MKMRNIAIRSCCCGFGLLMAIVLWNVENGIKKIDRDARMGISALSRSILGSSIIGMDDLSFASSTVYAVD